MDAWAFIDKFGKNVEPRPFEPHARITHLAVAARVEKRTILDRGRGFAGTFALLPVLGLAPPAAAQEALPAATRDCLSAGGERAVVVAAGPRGELRLADGRVARLAGFDPAQPTPGNPDLGEATRNALASDLTGKSVRVLLVAPKLDRWGRSVAFVVADGTAPAGGVAAQALAAGLGRYLAEPAAHACRANLIRAETAARHAKLGLWADPYYGVLAVDDRAAFAERTGTIVLFEGTVTEVQPSPFRTTLRFGTSGQTSRGVHMLVATILPRVMNSFRAQQMDVSQLVGRRIRIRGLLDMRFGPRIELNGPDDIEDLESSATVPSPN